MWFPLKVCETARSCSGAGARMRNDCLHEFNVRDSRIKPRRRHAHFLRLFLSLFEQYDPVVPPKKARFIQLHIHLSRTFDFAEAPIDVSTEPTG
jgi:hypothetical protein